MVGMNACDALWCEVGGNTGCVADGAGKREGF